MDALFRLETTNAEETGMDDEMHVMFICFEDMPTRETIEAVQEAEMAADKHMMTAVDTVIDDAVVHQRISIPQLTTGDVEPISIDNFLG